MDNVSLACSYKRKAPSISPVDSMYCACQFFIWLKYYEIIFYYKKKKKLKYLTCTCIILTDRRSYLDTLQVLSVLKATFLVLRICDNQLLYTYRSPPLLFLPIQEPLHNYSNLSFPEFCFRSMLIQWLL